MKYISFLFSLFLFLWYLKNDYKQGRGNMIKPLETAAAEENTPIKAAAAPKGNYMENRLKTLYAMHEEAAEEEEKQLNRVNHIKQLNQYGIVINEKNERRAKGELFRIQQKKLLIEKQIYQTEKAIAGG